MNAGHMEFCASEDWRRMVQDEILPQALCGVELGDAAIEIGPGPGFTTEILRTMTARLTAVEIDAGLAASLAERLARGNVDVVVGDATELDYGPDRFTPSPLDGVRGTCCSRSNVATHGPERAIALLREHGIELQVDRPLAE